LTSTSSASAAPARGASADVCTRPLRLRCRYARHARHALSTFSCESTCCLHNGDTSFQLPTGEWKLCDQETRPSSECCSATRDARENIWTQNNEASSPTVPTREFKDDVFSSLGSSRAATSFNLLQSSADGFQCGSSSPPLAGGISASASFRIAVASAIRSLQAIFRAYLSTSPCRSPMLFGNF